MRRILNILSKHWLLVIVIITGVILRFYKLEGFVTFLGDQGRDAIILKRIVTLEHFPAIGAPTSIGQVYLGPFYYYFISPWLFFFTLSPNRTSSRSCLFFINLSTGQLHNCQRFNRQKNSSHLNGFPWLFFCFDRTLPLFLESKSSSFIHPVNNLFSNLKH